MVVIVLIFIIIGKIINYILMIVFNFDLKKLIMFGVLIFIFVVVLKLCFNVVFFFGNVLVCVFLGIFLVYLLGILFKG